ncbi:L-arabinose isomerase [Neolewinella xylanilytica]|uniref:L-arabinose isomerase n=1 Tax=Neolewinella xylanilytica TaxID=1514080 RepID=A0A2S6I223_9BACT|nr:L-arabinose isomerase [Neolewinella xylanilytica]PPK85200.1 L-arabinose isomerase [Neolewinella xylanilytica]
MSNPLTITGKTLYFLTGSQHLYGEETLRQVAEDSRQVADALNGIAGLPVRVEWKPVLTTPDEIYRQLRLVETDDDCIGIICWMHTFSPAKMWIKGLQVLHKPMCHLHTQFLRDIPYANIDMDYMNLHQSAHGGREFGHICTRLGIPRRVIVGHWAATQVQQQFREWCGVALARDADRNMKVARFGDNMRQVAVTEGDKVAAQITLGYSVNGYGMGDLVERLDDVKETQIDDLLEEYRSLYTLADNLLPDGDRYPNLRYSARLEIGMRAFLEDGGFTAFTDTFENLTGMRQLPGLAVQRLMADGYGFGGEGDWKTAALVRTMKVMATGLEGGNSFMEDYTYHFEPGNESVLGSHMLEICPSIAGDKPRIECHPLGIGGKADPCRLVFNAGAGEALNASLVDMGDRFRLLINPVTAIKPKADLPLLPVARVLWQVKPDMATGVEAWIKAGGAHHTCYSQNLSVRQLVDYAEVSGVEALVIG